MSLRLGAGRRRRRLRLRGPPRRRAAHPDRAAGERERVPGQRRPGLGSRATPSTGTRPPPGPRGRRPASGRCTSPRPSSSSASACASRVRRRCPAGPRGGTRSSPDGRTGTCRSSRVRDGARLSVEPPAAGLFATTRSAWHSSPRGASPRSRSTASTSSPRARARSRTTRPPKGRHEYEVAAIDRYGAVGVRGHRQSRRWATSIPPAPPTGLVATPIVRDVQLTWNASPEPDVIGYVVLRDGARIGNASRPAYPDPGLPNGDVRLHRDRGGRGRSRERRVRAGHGRDRRPAGSARGAGHPRAHRRRSPAHPAAQSHGRGRLGGSGNDGDARGGRRARGSAPAEPGFEPRVERGRARRLARALGRRALRGMGGVGRHHRRAGAAGRGAGLPERRLPVVEHPLFSPDGSQLAFSRASPVGARPSQIALLSLPDGAVRVLLEGRDPAAKAWSPEGRRLALSLYDTRRAGRCWRCSTSAPAE